jgi:opacity protein-like surface antigen
MRKPFFVVGFLLLVTGMVLAQEPYPKVETSPAFMYIRTSPNLSRTFVVNGQVVPGEDLNCAGGGGTFTYNMSRFVGVGADLGACKFFGNTLGVGDKIDGNQATFLFGPRIAYRNSSRFTPFFDVQFGADRISLSCKNSTGTCASVAGTGTYTKTAFAMTAGGGLDVKLSRKVSLRLFQAEYLYTRFGNDCHFAGCNNNNNQNSFRLKSGVVFGWGGAPPAELTASCSVQPSEVMVGEPVTVTANGSNFNPKHSPDYSWNSTGGKISGTGSSVHVDTSGLAGGNYTATATITDPKLKKNNSANCSANFIVKEPPKNPPTMACSASPSSLPASGGSSTITCNCTSPDGVPVRVGDWSASSGSITGSDSTATLTVGASPGRVVVSATCTDARGLKSSVTTTQVSVENPPPPPPQASKLSQCDFPNPVKPWRVDNTCKAILDDVGKNLQQNTENKLVIVGNSEPTEKRNNLAAERAVNSKAYLTAGESKLGIDASRIETRTGSGGTKTAEYWIVPAGGTFSGEGTQTVDESQVMPVPDHPRAHKAAKKPAAQ